MSKYQVEFTTTLYVTVTVDADSAEEAAELADARMPRYPLSTPELMPGSPVDPGSGSYDGKGWEINSVTDEHGDQEMW